MPIKSYQDLVVWQKAMDLTVAVYKLSGTFPSDERFGLVSQVRRSSASGAANIAEGFGRESKGDFVRFLRIAQGSLKETETHILLSVRLSMVENGDVRNIMSLAEEVGKMLRSLIAKVSDKK